MLTATTYRGTRITRTEHGMWTVSGLDKLFTWNEACAYADSVATAGTYCGHYCRVCGTRELNIYQPEVAERLTGQSLCFTCCHWQRFAQRIATEPERHCVIDGHAYSIGPDNSATPFRGFGGRRFIVVPLDGTEPIATTNLWHHGVISWFWRSRLPDTARFGDAT